MVCSSATFVQLFQFILLITQKGRQDRKNWPINSLKSITIKFMPKADDNSTRSETVMDRTGDLAASHAREFLCEKNCKSDDIISKLINTVMRIASSADYMQAENISVSFLFDGEEPEAKEAKEVIEAEKLNAEIIKVKKESEAREFSEIPGATEAVEGARPNDGNTHLFSPREVDETKRLLRDINSRLLNCSEPDDSGNSNISDNSSVSNKSSCNYYISDSDISNNNSESIDNNNVNHSILFKCGEYEYTVADLLSNAESLLDSRQYKKVHLALSDWIDKRKIFRTRYFGNSSENFFPGKDDLLIYLSAHYNLLNELTIAALDGAFSFYDEAAARFLGAICNADSAHIGEELYVSVYSPKVLNVLYHIIRFTNHFSGMHSNSSAGINNYRHNNETINAVLKELITEKARDLLNLSTFYNGGEYFEVSEKPGKSKTYRTNALEIPVAGSRQEPAAQEPAASEPAASDYNNNVPASFGSVFVLRQKQWNESIKPISAVRLLEKIDAFGDSQEKKKLSALIVGCVDEAELRVLNDLVSEAQRTKPLENKKKWKIDVLGVSGAPNVRCAAEPSEPNVPWAEFWRRNTTSSEAYDLIIMLDCYGLYTNSLTDCERAQSIAVDRKLSYEDATSELFEPKTNQYAMSIAYINGVAESIRARTSTFVRERTLSKSTMLQIGSYLRNPKAKTKKVFFFISALPKDDDWDAYILSNMGVCREEIYETKTIMVLQAVNPNANKTTGKVKKPFTKDNDTTIRVNAWQIAKSVSSDVFMWLMPYYDQYKDKVKKPEISFYKLLMNTKATITYGAGNEGALEAGCCVEYCEKNDAPNQRTGAIKTKRNNDQAYKDMAKEFLLDYIKLASANELKPLYQRDTYVNGFLHCALQSVLTACLFGHIDSYNDLLFLYKLKASAYFRPWDFKNSSAAAVSENESEQKENIASATSASYYIYRALKQLDRPHFSSAGEVYTRQMIKKAFNPAIDNCQLFSNVSKQEYREAMRKISESCILLNQKQSYIFNNSTSAERN